MKLRYEFTETGVPDGIIAFAAGKDIESFHGFLKMNPVGAAIFHALSEEISEEALTAKIRNLYPEQPADTVFRAVCEFTGKLRQEGLLEEKP